MSRKIIAILLAALLILCAVQPAFAAVYPVYGDEGGEGEPSGGGGGGGSQQQPQEQQQQQQQQQQENITQAENLSPAVQTEDDEEAVDSVRETGAAAVNVSNKTEAKAELSAGFVNKLVESNLPLTVSNTGVTVQLPPAALNTNLVTTNKDDNTAKVEIGAQAVTPQQQQEIIEKTAVGQSTGIFTVGSVVVNLTANVVTSSGSTPVESFSEPVAVTIDLSNLTLTDAEIAQLTGTRLELDASGNYVTVNLGGSYDPATKTFTFYTEKFSLYTVMRVQNLVNVSLQVGIPVASFNGVNKSMDVPPMIVNGRTMVPLRYIGEALGAAFQWDEKTRTVTFAKDGQQLTLVIDKLQPGLDTPAIIQNGRTMVPVRYISESFGARVTWIPSTQKILVVK